MRCRSILLFSAMLLTSPFLRSAVAAEKQNPPTTNPAELPVLELRIPRTAVSFKMVKIPAGSIQMPGRWQGEDQRSVQIKSFWIGQTEVTWDEFDVWALELDLMESERTYVVGETRPSRGCTYHLAKFECGISEHAGLPAFNISSHSAKVYCEWLSHQLEKRFRLPTEAEWEYACRAGAKDDALDEKQLDKVAWYRDNSEIERELLPHRVAKKKPNAWGLYDMFGNIAEWVVPDDVPFVIKGGSFRSRASEVNRVWRQEYQAKWQIRDPDVPKSNWLYSDAPHVGFRILMED